MHRRSRVSDCSDYGFQRGEQCRPDNVVSFAMVGLKAFDSLCYQRRNGSEGL